MEDFKYKDITGKIISAAIQVHKTLGNGFQEVTAHCRRVETDLI